jgi:hypothetical protein
MELYTFRHCDTGERITVGGNGYLAARLNLRQRLILDFHEGSNADAFYEHISTRPLAKISDPCANGFAL